MVHIFLAPGFEELEAVAIADVLRRCQLEARFISMISARQVTGAHGIVISCDNLFRRSDLEGSECLILPGGREGVDYLARHEGLRKLLIKHNNYQGLIGAICAAPSVLGEHGLLQGRRATCYPGFETTLRHARRVEEDVVVDGNIITSKGPSTAVDFALTIAEMLTSSEQVRKVREELLLVAPTALMG